VSWEDQAEHWLAWARTPGHDAYWHYRDAFFPLVTPPGCRTLEVGCGEGRVARDLAARGHRVVALDSSPKLLRHAATAHAGGHYVQADAAALPFRDAEFDLVVAYNSLMDVEDMAGSVREAGRVLAPGGRLCFCVTHPFTDAGRFASRDPDASFVVTGSYLGPRRPFEGRSSGPAWRSRSAAGATRSKTSPARSRRPACWSRPFASPRTHGRTRASAACRGS
jgi:SAM-dependent methyltransferase